MWLLLLNMKNTSEVKTLFLQTPQVNRSNKIIVQTINKRKFNFIMQLIMIKQKDMIKKCSAAIGLVMITAF